MIKSLSKPFRARSLRCTAQFITLLFVNSEHESLKLCRSSFWDLPLLTYGLHLPQRLGQIIAEHLGRRLGARVLRLEAELDDLVAGEI